MVSKSDNSEKLENKKTTKKATQAKKTTVKKPAAAKKTAPKKETVKKTSIKNEVKVEDVSADKGMDKVVNEILEYNKKYVKSDRRKAEKEAIKGAKAENRNIKQTAVKENAIKSFTQNFLKKENISDNESKTCHCPFKSSHTLAAWGRAYKNMFNFKGRTSLFEFWSFALVNMFFFWGLFALLFGIVIHVSEVILTVLVVLFFLIQLIVGLSLSVRRIHDTGRAAFKGFYLPVIIWNIVAYLSTSMIFSVGNGWGLYCLYPIIIVASVVSAFYGFKIIFATLFGHHEPDDNEFGEAACERETDNDKTLTYICWVFTFNTIFAVLFQFVLALYAAYGLNLSNF